MLDLEYKTGDDQTMTHHNHIAGFEHAGPMGLNPQKLMKAFECIDREIEAGVIPGGVIAISRRGYTVTYAAGSAGISGEAFVPVQPDTLYDVASLTKVVVTLPLVLQLVEQGKLRLDDTVAQYFPAFAEAAPDTVTASTGKTAAVAATNAAPASKSSVTIRQLLTHTAGLKPFVNLHVHGWTREQIVSRVLAEPLQHEPGTQVVYSDLGYIVLGELAEQLHGMPLAEAAQAHILQPLGMRTSGYVPLSAAEGTAHGNTIAPTEWDEQAQAYRIGTVHDENAHAMGGISGHAGLFATATDLARYAAMWLHEGAAADGSARILSPATVRAAIRSHTGILTTGHRGLSWVLQGDPYDASGDLLSPTSYGHTGFTGTSLYVDPEYGLAVTLLTNRVHYGRSKSVAALRARLHNAIAGSLQ